MTRALSEVALIDSPTPMAWVKQLIDRLERRDLIDLQVVVSESAPLQIEPSPVLITQPPASLIGRAADAILLGRIDKPLFTQNPWNPEILDADLRLTLSRTSADLPHGDVIINLRSSLLKDTQLPVDGTPVWDAHVETLDLRIKDALLQRAPLNWIHLWAHIGGNSDGTPSSKRVTRIATNASPRQSYSYTDLRRAAYFSLPTLFESRLVWLSRGADIVQTEYSQSSPLANGCTIDSERHAACAQADSLAKNRFLPPVESDASFLKRTLSLWCHQSVARIRHRLWFEQWQLGFLKTDPNSTLGVDDTLDRTAASAPSSSPAALNGHTQADFAIIESPANTWWADPHLFQYEGALYGFFEEMRVDADHGHLSVARLCDDGQATEVCKILDDGNHLSYPFVFSADGNVFMIPETASRKSVLLYQATHFPDRWTLVSELLSDVDLADSTVHFDGERWWMFTNAMSHRSIDERDELHLYFADEIGGPWTPHPMNPVVTSVDRVRMAGAVIRSENHLYRPSQYGAVRYGYGINLYRIDTLNTQTYAETIVGRLLPEARGPWLGCHSISQANGTTVLDRVSRHRR